MIKYTCESSVKNQLFKTPFDNELDSTNRWVVLESLIPWDKMAKVFFDRLDADKGRETIDLRIVLGAMFIQHKLNLRDRETIQIIQENIYMQYFIGLPSFRTKAIFDHSLLTILRKRLGEEGSMELNDIFIAHGVETKQIKHRKSRTNQTTKPNKSSKDDTTKNGNNLDQESPSSSETEDTATQEVENKGTVKIDATVVPSDITYPTDTKLLNHARQISEQIIDILYDQDPLLWKTKPRTYRREARKTWLSFSRKRQSTTKSRYKQRKADLGYLRRNLRYINEMMLKLQQKDKQVIMPEQLRKKMYVISEVYRQQYEMHHSKTKSIKDRIVSISQPWVRPIVRGKAGSAVEFGAKINISLTENMVRVDQSSFDAFNEGKYLKDQIESYKVIHGYYPEYALADKIYLTRENRSYLKERGIKHTGPPLGRPPKGKKKESAEMKKKGNERNHVEGKIGQAKRKYGMDLLRTKTKQTSYCAINLIALVMNMLALQKRVFYLFFKSLKLRMEQDGIRNYIALYQMISHPFKKRLFIA